MKTLDQIAIETAVALGFMRSANDYKTTSELTNEHLKWFARTVVRKLEEQARTAPGPRILTPEETMLAVRMARAARERNERRQEVECND